MSTNLEEYREAIRILGTRSKVQMAMHDYVFHAVVPVGTELLNWEGMVLEFWSTDFSLCIFLKSIAESLSKKDA